MELLRKPKPQQPKSEDETTFTGLNAETKKIPKTNHDQHQLHKSGLETDLVPTNSPIAAQWTRKPRIIDQRLTNLLDMASSAPNPPPLFTLNDFVNEALGSRVVGNNLEAPLKSRENFNTFHSTPNGVPWTKKDNVNPPTIHIQDVINEVYVPQAELQRVPKRQKLIEMRAMIRETLQSTKDDDDDSFSMLDMRTQLSEQLYPNTNTLFCGGLARYFQGEARSNSPFILPDEDLMTISKTAVFNALRDGGRKLSLRAHFITSIPDITPLSLTLVDLNLSFNNFRTIPAEVINLPHLLTLSLRNNPIMQLPTDMSGLPRLKELNLSFCLIHHIPDGFFSLLSIEELNLSYNHLTMLPSAIVRLSSLQSLLVEGNQLPSLPFSILGLQKLQYIGVKNNFMSKVLWTDYSSNSPMPLKDMCAKMVIDFDVDYRAFCTDELSDWIDSNTVMCECCGGNLVGVGLLLTRSVMERTFGVRHLPLSFRTCSYSCFHEYNTMKNLDVPEGSQSSLVGMTLQQLSTLD